MIAVCAVAIISAWVLIISDPQRERRTQIIEKNVALKQQVQNIQLTINSILQQAKNDPNELKKKKINLLKKKLETVNNVLQKNMHGFVDPNKMAAALEDVLKSSGHLHLVKLKNLPAEYILEDNKKEKQESKKFGLYRHGFELELTGSYVDTAAYLKALEALQWDFYWDGIDIEMIKYPQAKITLKVHTLSLKEGWIGV